MVLVLHTTWHGSPLSFWALHVRLRLSPDDPRSPFDHTVSSLMRSGLPLPLAQNPQSKARQKQRQKLGRKESSRAGLENAASHLMLHSLAKSVAAAARERIDMGEFFKRTKIPDLLCMSLFS